MKRTEVAGESACPTQDGLFRFEDRALERRARPVLRRLPALSGAAIRVEWVRGLRDIRGPVHGGAFLRERRMAFDCPVREFPRIFVHETAHFLWLRLGNPTRRSWEEIVRSELRAGGRGELGWSAEWRKTALRPFDMRTRTRRWREYCCESFCDTAAWLYSGVGGHPEFTLTPQLRRVRAQWFSRIVASRILSI